MVSYYFCNVSANVLSGPIWMAGITVALLRWLLVTATAAAAFASLSPTSSSTARHRSVQLAAAPNFLFLPRDVHEILSQNTIMHKLHLNADSQACMLGGSMRFVNSSYILFGLPLVSEFGSVIGIGLDV